VYLSPAADRSFLPHRNQPMAGVASSLCGLGFAHASKQPRSSSTRWALPDLCHLKKDSEGADEITGLDIERKRAMFPEFG
jgi:hypothetical protein